MSENQRKSILEGCNGDTPMSLQYCSINLDVPKNARMLLSDDHVHPHRFLLYAATDNFTYSPKILNNPLFNSPTGIDLNKTLKGGIPIESQEPNFRWAFDAQRSIITDDGRIYVQAGYFKKEWHWYLDRVPSILEQCGEIFKGKREINSF